MKKILKVWMILCLGLMIMSSCQKGTNGEDAKVNETSKVEESSEFSDEDGEEEESVVKEVHEVRDPMDSKHCWL